MSFSIVQTIEGGKYLLSTVPDKWVSNGVLHWPQSTSILIKLRKIGTSAPKTSWDKFPCVVKKTGIKSYLEARQIEVQMLDWSNSESEPTEFIKKTETLVEKTKRASACTGNPNVLTQMLNFDEMFDTDVQVQTPTENCNQDQVDENCSQQLQSEFNMDDMEKNQNTIDISNILNFDFVNFEGRLANVDVSLCQVNTKLDKILSILEKGHNIVTTPDTDILQSFAFPLIEVGQVQELEVKLLDLGFKNKLEHELKRMNGTTGNLDGKKVGYKLVDWLFDRKLLMEYTWTGSSKNKVKLPFLALKQIIDMIFQIMNSSDTKCNKHFVEEFIKINILKYSGSRWHQIEHPHEHSSSNRKRKLPLNNNENFEIKSNENKNSKNAPSTNSESASISTQITNTTENENSSKIQVGNSFAD